MAEKLFLKDSSLKNCNAKVLAVIGNDVVLDKTVFYAQGGGQPCDVGKIFRGEEEFNVTQVKNSESDVVHTVDKIGLVVGDEVTCVIDWARRHKLMRTHTSAHILAAVLFKETGALITGNQLGLDDSRMDFSVKDFDRNLLTSVEGKSNDVINSGLEIKISFEEREKALARAELFRLKDVLPKDIPVFRIVSIGDFDVQADGGTHVRNTKEVGRIKIIDLKNKGAENRRIYWQVLD